LQKKVDNIKNITFGKLLKETIKFDSTSTESLNTERIKVCYRQNKQNV